MQALPTVIAPTDTPQSTDTPEPTVTPEPADTPPTVTPIIRLAAPTAPPVAAPFNPPAPTSTPPPAEPSSAGPIKFRGVRFVSAVRDPSRPPEGAIDTLSVEFSGSRPPFTVKHDEMVGSSNPNGDGTFDDAGVIYTFIYFQIRKTCGGPIPGTVTVVGGDGQSFTQAYYIGSSSCP